MGNDFLYMKRGRCAAPGSEGSGGGGGGWRRRLGPTTSAGCVEGGRRPRGAGGTGLRPEGCGRLMAVGYIRFAQGATAAGAAIFKVSVTGLSPALIVILTPGEEFWYM